MLGISLHNLKQVQSLACMCVCVSKMVEGLKKSKISWNEDAQKDTKSVFFPPTLKPQGVSGVAEGRGRVDNQVFMKQKRPPSQKKNKKK